MNEKNEAFNIDVRKLLLFYLRRWWAVALAVVLCAGASFAYTYYSVTPLYRASTTIYVNNMKEGTSIDSISSGNLTTSQKLVTTYINIVQSNRVLEKASKALNYDYSADQLSGMISAAQIGETEIFAIYVTGAVPEETARIANKMAEVVPIEIGTLIEGSSAWVIDSAKVPTYRCSPSYRSCAMKGGAAGGMCVVAVLTVLFLLDVRVKDEEELTTTFDLPVLGSIPKFEQYTKGKYGYSKSQYAYYGEAQPDATDQSQ